MNSISFYLTLPILFDNSYWRLLPKYFIAWLVARIPVVVKVEDVGVKELQYLSLEVFCCYFFSFHPSFQLSDKSCIKQIFLNSSMKTFYVPVLLFSVDEPVSSEITLDHLNQVSLYPINPDIAELCSPIELKGNIFECDSYIQHQFFEHIKCQHYTALASVISIETKSCSTLVIPERDLVEIDIEEPKLYVVRYIRQVLDIYLPSMKCLV